MDEKLEAAQVLDDAADYLLIHGVNRGGLGDDGGPRCAMGALISGAKHHWPGSDVVDLAASALREVVPPANAAGFALNAPIFQWSDRTTDDGEVIDTLRHVAKDLRAEVYGG